MLYIINSTEIFGYIEATPPSLLVAEKGGQKFCQRLVVSTITNAPKVLESSLLCMFDLGGGKSYIRVTLVIGMQRRRIRLEQSTVQLTSHPTNRALHLLLKPISVAATLCYLSF